MKKIKVLAVAGVMLAFAGAGCMQKPMMDEATMMKKVDSAFTAQKQTIADAAMKDCDANKANWIQTKADSIYMAESAEAALKK